MKVVRKMAKVLRCRDLGFDCDAVVHAHSEKELVELVKEHARKVHNIEEMTDEIIAKVRSSIKEEG